MLNCSTSSHGRCVAYRDRSSRIHIVFYDVLEQYMRNAARRTYHINVSASVHRDRLSIAVTCRCAQLDASSYISAVSVPPLRG